MFFIRFFFCLFFLNFFGADGTLQWPQTYHFKAILKIPSANLEEPYEVWSNGFNRHHRFDFYQGMPKMYQKRRGLVNNIPQFQYYWVRPEFASSNQNKTACYELKNTASEVKLLYNYLPPMFNFSLKGPDVNQTSKWELSYTEQKYGAVYNYAIWTTGSTNDWVPVRFEYRMFYKGVERDFMQHIYKNFNRIKPDSDVFRIPHDLRCKPISEIYFDEEFGVDLGYMKPILQYNMTELFERFKATHNKRYSTNEEHFMRFTVFLKKYRYIQSVNRQRGSFKLAVNQFTDMTKHELSRLRNGAKVEPELLELKSSFRDNDTEDDKGFDWRWYDAVSPVKDQTFLCGSCYAFASAAAIESAAYVSKGCRNMLEVSEQAIIDCSRGPNGTGNQGCTAGYLYKTLQWVKKNGIPMRKDYGPYLAMEGYCKLKQPRLLYISSYKRLLNDIKSIKDALRQHGPLAALIHVPDSLFYHISGIYDDKKCDGHVTLQLNKTRNFNSKTKDSRNLSSVRNYLLSIILFDGSVSTSRVAKSLSGMGRQTHAVVIVGFGKENGRRYWLIKNSWGSQWSDKGYFKLDMDNNLCGITNVVYAIVHPQSHVKNCKKKHGDSLP